MSLMSMDAWKVSECKSNLYEVHQSPNFLNKAKLDEMSAGDTHVG